MNSIARQLSAPEFIAAGDGWGEARRRRVMAAWLQAQGFTVHLTPKKFNDRRAAGKYRLVDLVAEKPGLRGRNSELVLSLVHPAGIIDSDLPRRQAECDRILFSKLQNLAGVSRLELRMSQTCLGLTP